MVERPKNLQLVTFIPVHVDKIGNSDNNAHFRQDLCWAGMRCRLYAPFRQVYCAALSGIYLNIKHEHGMEDQDMCTGVQVCLYIFLRVNIHGHAKAMVRVVKLL